MSDRIYSWRTFKRGRIEQVRALVTQNLFLLRVQSSFSLLVSQRLVKKQRGYWLIEPYLLVIAFEPTSARSTTFLRLLYFLVPSIHQQSVSCSNLLRDGIDALAGLLSKSSDGKDKSESIPAATGGATESATALHSMRQSFLSLADAYLQAGGDIGSSARRILEVVHHLLRPPTVSALALCSTFIESYTLNILGPRAAHTDERVLAFLRQILPFVRLYINRMKFDVLFDSFANRPQTKDTTISDLVFSSIIPLIVNAFSANSVSNSTLFPSQHSASRLVAAYLTYHSRSTVVSEFDQHPSPAFLSTFIYPLTIDFGTGRTLEYETAERKALSQGAWREIVGYMVRARREVELPSTRSTRSRLATIAISCQILKVSIVLGGEYLAQESGAFTVLALVLENSLKRGGSGFLIDNEGRHRTNLMESTPSLGITTQDYILWSFLEFLVLYPTPLLIHLRGLLRAKLIRCRPHSSGLPQPTTTVFSHPLLQRVEAHHTATQQFSSRPSPQQAASNILSPPSASNFEYLSSTPTSSSETTVHSPMLCKETLERIHIVQVLQGEVPIAVSVDGIESRTRRWTRDEAVRKLGQEMESLKIEYRDILTGREQT